VSLGLEATKSEGRRGAGRLWHAGTLFATSRRSEMSNSLMSLGLYQTSERWSGGDSNLGRMVPGWIRLQKGESGALVSATLPSTWFIVLIHGRLTLNRVRLWLAFLRGVFLACQLLFDQFVMDSNRTNFGELALPGPRTSRVRRSRAKRRRLKVPLRPSADRPRPAVGTLTRTRNLILAALRVWELKQGIRS